jgi:hypothetical protein
MCTLACECYSPRVYLLGDAAYRCQRCSWLDKVEKPTLVDWSLSIKQTEAARAKMDTEVPVSIYIYIYNMYNYIYIYITYFCFPSNKQQSG